MADTIAEMNIYQKLAAIRQIVEVVKKDKKGFNYSYASIEEILVKVTAGMKKYHVSLIPMVLLDEKYVANMENVGVSFMNYTKTKSTKDGKIFEEQVNEYIACFPMLYTWVNNDNPDETIDIVWYVSGSQQDPSQALGSAMTYGLRQFLTQFFQIVTSENDPNNFRSKQQAASALEDKLIAQSIINSFDELVKAYLSENAGKSDAVKKFVQTFIKDGNYFAIESSIIAAKLLNDFKHTFIGESEE